MNKNDTILEQLRTLGLTNEEAKLYLELLKEPSTHLRLAHSTGINRTKIYRLADDLQRRGLITKRTDDRGTFLIAADPGNLEVSIVNQEKKLEYRRKAFQQLLPLLQSVQAQEAHSFVVLTYEGIEGFKQMLWHELKTKGENLILGGCPIERLVPDRAWAEKHRAMTVEASYAVRELDNPGDKDTTFTENPNYMESYSRRLVPHEALAFYDQIAIYNNTVATYHWRGNQRVGFEVVSSNYATLMRQVFEHYWQLSHLS